MHFIVFSKGQGTERGYFLFFFFWGGGGWWWQSFNYYFGVLEITYILGAER